MKKLALAAVVAALFSVSAQAAVDLSALTQSGQVSIDASNTALLTANGTLSANVTDLLSFEWRFDAVDYLPFNDYAQVVLGNTSYTLSDVGTVGDYGDSGWNTFTLNSAFSGYVQFGVFNVLDDALDSQLYIRNVAATAAAPVPEPETYAMLLGGLGLMGLAARRRKAATRV